MKLNQQGIAFGKLLVSVAVFVAAVVGFLVLTDPSSAGRTHSNEPVAAQAHASDARAPSASEDPSLPAAADVLVQPMPSETPAPTF